MWWPKTWHIFVNENMLSKSENLLYKLQLLWKGIYRKNWNWTNRPYVRPLPTYKWYRGLKPLCSEHFENYTMGNYQVYPIPTFYKMCLWNTNAPDKGKFQRWSRSQGQIFWCAIWKLEYFLTNNEPTERFLTRSSHVKYQSSSNHCSKVISKVGVLKKMGQTPRSRSQC